MPCYTYTLPSFLPPLLLSVYLTLSLRMPLKKVSHDMSSSSPEHMVSQQVQYLTNKYKNLFTNQASENRHTYAYPPPKQSAVEGEMRALEENMAKGGHGVPLSSESDEGGVLYSGDRRPQRLTLRRYTPQTTSTPSTTPRSHSVHHPSPSRSSSTLA